jgi:hypothetical protein
LLSVVLCALLGLALWQGIRASRRVMNQAYRDALPDTAPWADAVIREVPEGAVVLSDDPWSAWWHADRASVLAPTSHRSGLLQVLRRYRPTHFLYVDHYGVLGGRPPFFSAELSRVDGGSGPRRWALYRIRPEVFERELPATVPDPRLRPR